MRYKNLLRYESFGRKGEVEFILSNLGEEIIEEEDIV